MAEKRLKSTFNWGIGVGLQQGPGLASVITQSELLRSHEELRAVLAVAGEEIRKLSIGRPDTPVLRLVRRVLRESRSVAAAARAIRE